jgi:hypothetical protein
MMCSLQRMRRKEGSKQLASLMQENSQHKEVRLAWQQGHRRRWGRHCLGAACHRKQATTLLQSRNR